jgi:hypothetical protein
VSAWRAASPVWVWRFGLVLVTIVGILVRLPSFRDSLFGDEISTFYIMGGHGPATILHLLNGDGIDVNPPLYHLLTWCSVKLFGLSVEYSEQSPCSRGSASSR